MQYTLKQLRYLVAAAEHGSVSAAAQSLFVSQPTLSSAIAQLEGALGVQLLIRHHARGVSLTPAGQTLLARARNLLAHAEDLWSETRALGESLEGELVVGCFVTLSPFYLPRLLSAFNTEHPSLRISLVEGALDRLQRALLSGDVEIALLYELDLDETLAVETLAETRPHLLLEAHHPLAGCETVSLADFVDEPMVLLDLPHSRDYFRALFVRLGFEPQVRYRTLSFELVRGLVGRGHGYSILNLRPSVDTTYDGGEVRCVRIREQVAPLPVALAWPRDARLTRRAQAFASYCRRFFSAIDS